MDGFRYFMAVLMAVSVPSAVLYWFAIHPFVGFWRRLGTKLSFTMLTLGFVGCIYACWLIRATLVGRDLGTNWWLFVPGLLLYLAAARMSIAVRRHLKLRTLVGLPEIAMDGGAGKLLNEGIYGRIRHPRYAAFLLGSAGVALIVNYSGLYVITAVSFPALHLIAVIEERELHERFGAAYAEYAAAVPRLIPRFRGG